MKEDLESYKIEYKILLSRYEKLVEENKKLKEDNIILSSSKEVLENVGSLVDSMDQETLKKAYDSIKKRHQLGVLLGM
jgi:spore maturation protein CgeB